MKRKLLLTLILLPSLLSAGVIMKHSGERLEDVTIKSIANTEIVYIDENGTEFSIPKNEVSAILYDDGRYEEIKAYAANRGSSNQGAQMDYTPAEIGHGTKAYNVFAYGIYAMMYVSNEKYYDAIVEYRVIYKSQKEEPPFKYLGTTPFAYVTEQMYNNPLTGKGNPYLVDLMRATPLVIENAKDVKKVEFRLSKEGYKTVIVKPINDVLIGGGPVMFISLDKLKPLKEGESNEEIIVAAAIIDSQEENQVESDATSKSTESINDVSHSYEMDEEINSPSNNTKKQDGAILVHYKSKAERKRFRHSKEFSYGDIEMDENEMLAFLAVECPEAFKMIISAKELQISGWSIFGMTASGCLPLYIPLLSVGYVRYDKAIEYFNDHCSK